MLLGCADRNALRRLHARCQASQPGSATSPKSAWPPSKPSIAKKPPVT
jgi:hypothetical protein